MSKPRTCTNCGKVIPIDHGYSFDDKLNLIHDECQKIAFSVLKSSYTPPTYSHAPQQPAFPELGNRYNGVGGSKNSNSWEKKENLPPAENYV